METKPSHIPVGYHTVTPYLIITDAARALEFYQQAFGASEVMRLPGPDGRIMHAEIQIGDSRIMLADECPEMEARSPQSIGGTPVGVMLYLKDVDTVTTRAVALGARVLRPMQDQFYGDRTACIVDPFGHQWTLATHIEDVSPEEIDRRFAALFGPKQPGVSSPTT